MGVTLREGNREYFYKALDKNFAGLKGKYISRYGNDYEVPSPNAKVLMEIFKEKCYRNGIMSRPEDCFNYLHEFSQSYKQMSLFDFMK